MTRTPPAERPLPDQERLFADVLTRLDLSDVIETTRVTEVTRTRPHRRLTQVVGTAAAAAVVVAGVAVVSRERLGPTRRPARGERPDPVRGNGLARIQHLHCLRDLDRGGSCSSDRRPEH